MRGSYGKARRRLHRGARVATNRSTWPRRPTEPFDADVEEVGGSLHLRIPRVSAAPVAPRDYQAIQVVRIDYSTPTPRRGFVTHAVDPFSPVSRYRRASVATARQPSMGDPAGSGGSL